MGPQGPAGPQGATGPQGPAGPRGPAGPSLASLSDLGGIACSVAGAAGTLTVVVDSSGQVTLTCTTSPPPPPPPLVYEALDTSADGVGRAIAFVLGNNTFDVPANCATNPTVNCLGGTPTSTQVHLDSPTTAVTGGPTSYTFSITGRVATVSDIAFSYSDGYVAVACSVGVDTNRSGVANATVTGTASFVAAPNSGPNSRLVGSDVIVSGIESGDLLFSGGGGVCGSLGPTLAPLFLSTIQSQIAQRISLSVCGAPGPDEFVVCQ
jgi:hypothetical protein